MYAYKHNMNPWRHGEESLLLCPLTFDPHNCCLVVILLFGGHPAVNRPPITAHHGHEHDSVLTAAVLWCSWPHIHSMSRNMDLTAVFVLCS